LFSWNSLFDNGEIILAVPVDDVSILVFLELALRPGK